MGIKEGTCDEHWVLYVSEESLGSTSETNIAQYVQQTDLLMQHCLASVLLRR